MGKLLFIINSTETVYGASKSIQQVLRNIRVDYDLIYPNSLFHKTDVTKMREFASNSHLKNVYSFFLPDEHYSLGYEEWGGIKGKILSIRKQLWRLDYHRIVRLIKKGEYSAIHLNCNNLAPLIDEKYPYVLHVREVFDDKLVQGRFFLSQLERAKGVIYIDSVTYNAIKKHHNNKEMILMNPVCMDILAQLSDQDILESLSLPNDFQDNIIFSVIGALTRIKGVLEIIEAFSACNKSNIRLLIIGKGNGEYAEKCVEYCKKDKRIIYLGELPYAYSIYKISDYIIRGENFFAQGRTVYEGLYAGCGVIIPGTDENGKDIFEYNKFDKKIFFYTPGCGTMLTKRINELSSQKVCNKEYLSNVDDYLKKFVEFIIG